MHIVSSSVTFVLWFPGVLPSEENLKKEQVISGTISAGILACFFLSHRVLGIILGMGTLSSALGIGFSTDLGPKCRFSKGGLSPVFLGPRWRPTPLSLLPLFLFSLSFSCFLFFLPSLLSFTFPQPHKGSMPPGSALAEVQTLPQGCKGIRTEHSCWEHSRWKLECCCCLSGN